MNPEPRATPYIDPYQGPPVSCEPCRIVGRKSKATHILVHDEDSGEFEAMCEPCVEPWR